MRRNKPDDRAPRTGPPPFRILGGPNSSYLSTSPPPAPAAPEPYKVARSSSSSSRIHRKSSFVIIAEARPTTPSSRSPSPSLATGRVSPFRGRGFRGPPPHAQSRPQTPDKSEGRRRGRSGRSARRASVSQRNSPKRSLIPQPTRPRSISLTKSEDRRESPGYNDRRATSKDRANVTTSNRRASLRAPGLSPIQGTPTKPIARRDLSRDKRLPTTLLPPKSVSNSRRPSRERSPGSKAQVVSSPSKIPLKRVAPSQLSGKRLPTTLKRKKLARKTAKRSNDEAEEKDEATNDRADSEIDSRQSRLLAMIEDEQPETKSRHSEEETKTNDDDDDDDDDDDSLGLVDLLKQSSGAGGTSSMVNTTTVTAVRPLNIDTTTILMESETIDRTGSRAANGGAKNERSKVTTRQDKTSDQERKESGNLREMEQSNEGASDGDTTRTTMSSDDRKTDSSNEAGNDAGSSSRSVEKATNDANDPAGNQSNGGKRGQAVVNDRRNRANGEMERNDVRKSQSSNGILCNGGDKAEKSSGTIERVGYIDDPIVRTDKLVDERGQMAVSTGQRTTDSRDVDRTRADSSTNESIAKSSTQSTKKASGAINVSSANGAITIRSVGSNASMKSSTGVSTSSVGSVRSTDTGVSVNTVRGGLSSAREKKGTHLVKRTQEIETLSGNVVHLERNGEPTVLAAGHEEERVTEERSYWKKFSGRYRECCSSMRCLACRRGPKGRSWPGKAATVESASDGAERPAVGCWSRLKTACKCHRWKQQSKCCVRGRQVAPAAEGTACCPPERRCGVLCRRLFARCRCSRRHDATRTRSIRAKQSLTSVAAAPPLSEEPKAKIPEVLVEHNSLMRGAIPCLPVPLAWFCLVWNVLLPGSGTFWSGLFDLCAGQPRFSAVAGPKARLGALIVNLIVGIGQLFTVLFCLVGWGWSIWWGITMVRLARKYKRFRDSEAANSDPEARVGEEAAALPPGVPSQALRGVERAR